MIRVVSCLVILGRNHFFVPLLPELRLCHFLTFHSTNLLFWTLTGCCSWYKFFPLSSGITLSYFHHRFQHRNHCQKVWFLFCTETKYQSELLVKLWTLYCLISFIQLTFLKVIFTSTARRQRKLFNRQHSPKPNYKGFADRCHLDKLNLYESQLFHSFMFLVNLHKLDLWMMCGELTFIDLGKIVSGNSYVFKSEIKKLHVMKSNSHDQFISLLTHLTI